MKKFILVILITAIFPDLVIWWLYFYAFPVWFSILWFFPSLLLFVAWVALVLEYHHSLAARILNSCILCIVVPKIFFLLFQYLGIWIGLSASAMAELLAIYGLTLGWRRLKVKNVQITFPNLPSAFNGYRILHLSDLHLGSFGRHSSFVRKIVTTANRQSVDVIVFTGDLVNKVARETIPYRHILGTLHAPDGVFAVLGNHDYCEYGPKRKQGDHDRNLQQLNKIIYSMRWQLLLDEYKVVERQGENIAIAGVENIGLPPFPVKGNLVKALQGIKKGTFTILLSHDPNHWRQEVVRKTDISLTLSGHTHGAQLQLGRLSLARFAFKEWGGLYHQGSQWLYVSLGLGGAFPFRLGAWPEMTVIELKKE